MPVPNVQNLLSNNFIYAKRNETKIQKKEEEISEEPEGITQCLARQDMGAVTSC